MTADDVKYGTAYKHVAFDRYVQTVKWLVVEFGLNARDVGRLMCSQNHRVYNCDAVRFVGELGVSGVRV